MKIGYARVSSVGQSLENQIESLTKEGCEKIFKEKASGKSAENREQLQVALDFVREGDVLVITKLDRLARSMIDLSQISKKLKEKHVGLKALDQPDIDTTSAIGELLFNVLGAVAAFERSLINERTAEGRIKAIAKGVKFGAKAKLTDLELRSMAADFHSNEYTKTDLAKKYKISRASLYQLVGNHEIEAAIVEADDPNTVWVSNDDANKSLAKKRKSALDELAALSQELGMYPTYAANDGPLSNTQIQAIRDAVPQNKITVKSSLFGGTSVSDDFMDERGAQKPVERGLVSLRPNPF